MLPISLLLAALSFIISGFLRCVERILHKLIYFLYLRRFCLDIGDFHGVIKFLVLMWVCERSILLILLNNIPNKAIIWWQTHILIYILSRHLLLFFIFIFFGLRICWFASTAFNVFYEQVILLLGGPIRDGM